MSIGLERKSISLVSADSLCKIHSALPTNSTDSNIKLSLHEASSVLPVQAKAHGT